MLNICIRNHPQRERENVNDIVSDLLTDGLQLFDTSFEKTNRKGRDDGKAGVIIVTCKSMEDKAEIMKRKRQLKKNRKYERVYIHADQSLETRVNNNNLKTLLSALGVKGLKLKGSRLVTENDSHDEIPTQNTSERDNMQRRRETRDTRDATGRRDSNRNGHSHNAGTSHASGYNRNYRHEENRGSYDWDRREYRHREQRQDRHNYTIEAETETMTVITADTLMKIVAGTTLGIPDR